MTKGWLTSANGLSINKDGQSVPTSVEGTESRGIESRGIESQGTESRKVVNRGIVGGMAREREDMYVLLKLALIMTCQVVA